MQMGQDRYATTTRKPAHDYNNATMISHNNNNNNSSNYNQYGEAPQLPREPVPAKRHHISDLGAVQQSNRNENTSYSAYDQQHRNEEHQMMQQRKHLEDVTNYDQQAMMHNTSYGSGQGGPNDSISSRHLAGDSSNNNNNSHHNISNPATPLIIGNPNLDPVSLMTEEKDAPLLDTVLHCAI